MELRDIRYIVALKKYSSISQAAKELYVPQPTLSNVLKRVEVELGKQLFVRTKAGLIPTDAGLRFVEMAEKLLDMNNELLAEMASFEGEQTQIRVGSPDIWCAKLVAPAAAAFMKANPGLQMTIRNASNAELEQQLENGKIDLAILHLPLLDMDQFEYQELFDEQILVAISQRYWETYSAMADMRTHQITLTELANQHLIFTAPERSVRRKIEIALKNNHIPYNVSVITNDLESSLILAESGAGVAFISDKAKVLYEQRFHLAFLHADNFLPKWKVVAVRKKGKELPLIKEFSRQLFEYADKLIL